VVRQTDFVCRTSGQSVCRTIKRLAKFTSRAWDFAAGARARTLWHENCSTQAAYCVLHKGECHALLGPRISGRSHCCRCFGFWRLGRPCSHHCQGIICGVLGAVHRESADGDATSDRLSHPARERVATPAVRADYLGAAVAAVLLRGTCCRALSQVHCVIAHSYGCQLVCRIFRPAKDSALTATARGLPIFKPAAQVDCFQPN
jgi:hypothetical protein